MSKQKAVSLYLNDELLLWVESKANELGLSRNAYITMILTKEKRESEVQKGHGE